MSTQINRLAADEAVQALKVATSSHQPEAAVALQKDLITVVGEPVRVDVAQVALLETRDEEGFAFLQSL